jgi:hypothetical protein
MNDAYKKFIKNNYEVLMFEQNYKFYVITRINGQEQSRLDFATREDADQHFEDMIDMPTDVSFFSGQLH